MTHPAMRTAFVHGTIGGLAIGAFLAVSMAGAVGSPEAALAAVPQLAAAAAIALVTALAGRWGWR